VDEAIRLAGQQLIRNGMMNSKVLEAISQPLIAEAELRERYNRMYERAKQASG
jgi:hypothetical protein